MGRRQPAPANPVLSRDAHARLSQAGRGEVRSVPRVPSKARDPAQDQAEAPEEADRLWQAATRDVAPLARGGGAGSGVRGLPVGVPVGPTRDPDAEAWEVLLRFVRGEGRFDLSDQDEWVEGCWHELDPTVMRRLRRGEFSVQGHVDLHGLVVEEAHVALAGFVRQGRLAGKRCLLVVHGRGHHSKDRTPVLKERVVAWLSRGRLAREILAFCTARPHDGGAGALYVLLRRGGEQRPPARRRDGEARPAGTAGEAATAGQGRGAGPGARGPLTRGEARRGMQRRPDRTDPLAPLCRGP